MPEQVDSTTDEGIVGKISTVECATPKDKAKKSLEKSVAEESPKYDLSKFELKRILNNNCVRKSIALLGTFPAVSSDDEAIVVFEKQAFIESDVNTNDQSDDATENESNGSYFSDDLIVHTEFVNNIYGSYRCVPSTKLSGVKATVVYPATEKHIEKYSVCQKYIINETADLYNNVTLPYIKASQFTLDWVYNILDHKQETERIVFEDNDPETGFVLLPDLKWDGRNVETLYLLAIIHKRDIKSLRDLNETHLPMLHNLRQSAATAIEERYGLSATQLRMYFHYQPSFYHLHVHINPVRNDAPGIWCEKSHMLDTVINNLELLPDYYQRAKLPFVLYEGNKLLDLYEQKLSVRKRVKTLKDTTDEDERSSKRLKLTESDEKNISI